MVSAFRRPALACYIPVADEDLRRPRRSDHRSSVGPRARARRRARRARRQARARRPRRGRARAHCGRTARARRCRRRAADRRLAGRVGRAARARRARCVRHRARRVQQRRGRAARRRVGGDRSRLALGARCEPLGCHPRRARLHPDPAAAGRRRPHREHRLGGGPDRAARHGRLQRDQARGGRAQRDPAPRPRRARGEGALLGRVPGLLRVGDRRLRAQPPGRARERPREERRGPGARSDAAQGHAVRDG